MINLNTSNEGRKNIILYDIEWLYMGELDSEGEACGFGVAICVDNPHQRNEGIFYDNKLHGFGKTTGLLVNSITL